MCFMPSKGSAWTAALVAAVVKGGLWPKVAIFVGLLRLQTGGLAPAGLNQGLACKSRVLFSS